MKSAQSQECGYTGATTYTNPTNRLIPSIRDKRYAAIQMLVGQNNVEANT
jgi:hypothetical protein